jgi:hypothetical protein
MNDNTRIRIAVPAHLYESVKKQLTLKEGAYKDGTYSQPVKEKKSSTEKKNAEGGKVVQSFKETSDKKEKTVEERLATLEKLVKAMAKDKSVKEEGIEDEIGYEAGEQQPDDKPGVPKSLAGQEDTNLEKLKKK